MSKSAVFEVPEVPEVHHEEEPNDGVGELLAQEDKNDREDNFEDLTGRIPARSPCSLPIGFKPDLPVSVPLLIGVPETDASEEVSLEHHHQQQVAFSQVEGKEEHKDPPPCQMDSLSGEVKHRPSEKEQGETEESVVVAGSVPDHVDKNKPSNVVLLGFGLSRSTQEGDIKHAFAAYDILSVDFPPSRSAATPRGSRPVPAIATLTFPCNEAAAAALRDMHQQSINGARVRLEYPSQRTHLSSRPTLARSSRPSKPAHTDIEPSPDLVCFNLSPTTGDLFLKGLFASAHVSITKLVVRGTPAHPLIFVQCGSTDEAKRALDTFHDSLVDDRVLRIEFARQRTPRSSTASDAPLSSSSHGRRSPRRERSSFERRASPRRDYSPRRVL